MPRTKHATNGALGTGVALMTPREIQEAARLGGQITAAEVAGLLHDVRTLMEQIEDRMDDTAEWLSMKTCARLLGITADTFRDTRLDWFRERDGVRKGGRGCYLIRRESWKAYIENLPAE